MKSIFFLFLIFFCCSTMAFNNHYIFLIHGIAGNPKNFGHFEESFLLNTKNKLISENFIVKKFSYETTNDTLSVSDFSLKLAEYISNSVNEANTFDSTDSISLVMHSQGGLIGIDFIYNLFNENPDFHPELKNHIKNFITVGTPFWGSKVASLGELLKEKNYSNLLKFLNKFGLKQLEDMSLASESSYLLRSNVINNENENLINQIKKNIRFLQISAYAEKLNFLSKYESGDKIFENDIAVPIPSAHFDFLYNEQNTDSFKETHLVEDNNQLVVNALHTSLFPNSPNMPSLIYVPKKCIDLKIDDCPHPTFSSIANFILNNPIKQTDAIKLTSFSIDLRLNFPENKILKDIGIEFADETDETSVQNKNEFYNKKVITKNNIYKIYKTGYFTSNSKSNYSKIKIKIKEKENIIKEIQVPVKRATNTFVEFNLN